MITTSHDHDHGHVSSLVRHEVDKGSTNNWHKSTSPLAQAFHDTWTQLRHLLTSDVSDCVCCVTFVHIVCEMNQSGSSRLKFVRPSDIKFGWPSLSIHFVRWCLRSCKWLGHICGGPVAVPSIFLIKVLIMSLTWLYSKTITQLMKVCVIVHLTYIYRRREKRA